MPDGLSPTQYASWRLVQLPKHWFPAGYRNPYVWPDRWCLLAVTDRRTQLQEDRPTKPWTELFLASKVGDYIWSQLLYGNSPEAIKRELSERVDEIAARKDDYA